MPFAGRLDVGIRACDYLDTKPQALKADTKQTARRVFIRQCETGVPGEIETSREVIPRDGVRVHHADVLEAALTRLLFGEFQAMSNLPFIDIGKQCAVVDEDTRRWAPCGPQFGKHQVVAENLHVAEAAAT